ncbi:MAG: M20 metallopeptidase family protein [Solirubrobacteraceae bacterium]
MPPSFDALPLLLDQLERELPGALELRRKLHAAPELAHGEHETAASIAAALEMEVQRVSGTGLLVRAGHDGLAVAVRAELDGLPVVEQTGAPWAARNGAMHACGHDVHAAALVALVRACRASEASLPAPLIGLFQPSEEAYPSGAQLMVQDGSLDGAVRAVVGVHVHPDLPWGALSVASGAINAACDSVEITVEGRQAHGAYPHLGRDPVLAISSIVVGLHTLVARRVNPLHSAVLSVGSLHSGSADNIIPQSAHAALTLRTDDQEDRRVLRESIAELVESTARAHGCIGRIEITEGEPVLRNDERICQRAQAIASAAGVRVAGPWRSCGSDDFSFFGALAPIAMAFSGLANAPGFAPRPLHHPEFLPPDDAVAAVARAQAVMYLAAASD